MIYRGIEHEDGKTIFSAVQDCEPILNLTKELSNSGAHGSSEMRHAAKIPFVIVERYCNDNKITFQEFMNNQEHIRILLNSPDLAHFRVWKGKI